MPLPRAALLCLATLLLSRCAFAGSGDAAIGRQPHSSYWKDAASYEKLFAHWDGTEIERLPQNSIGVIAPHHLFVGHEIARLYTALSDLLPSVIVLIGPNHFSLGTGKIQTTDRPFTTPYGLLEPARKAQDDLKKRERLTVEPTTFTYEHAISAHVAFIMRTFPRTTLLPIVLASTVTEEEALHLGRTLATILPQDALVIASVDFSHDLPKDVSNLQDEESHRAITQFDIDAVATAHLDSPPSITALLSFLRARNAEAIVYDRHTNSAEFIAGPPPAATTSHFFMVWMRP